MTSLHVLPTLLRSTRGPFLILAPVCVLLGLAVTSQQAIPLDTLKVILIFVGALCAHISVNVLNEYLDFQSGLDLTTQRTPFSGGSGALPAEPTAARAALVFSVVTLMISALIGLYFVWLGVFKLLLLGLLGLVLIVTYTRQINRSPLLCLVAPGAGFGIAMVVGTGYALGASDVPALWLAALVPFFLVNNLLLLNQFPDIEPDRAVGRHHFPIAYGTSSSTFVYALFAFATAATIGAGVIGGWFPIVSLLALLPLSLTIIAFIGAKKLATNIGSEPKYMAANVAATLLTPTALALSLLLA